MRALRLKSGLSVAAFASRLSVSPRTYESWEYQGVQPKQKAVRAMWIESATEVSKNPK